MPLCKYGCGKEAVHRFKNGIWCCESHFLKCPTFQKNNCNCRKGKKNSKEHNLKIANAQLGEKNHRYGKKNSKEHRKKISEGNKGNLPWHAGTIGAFSKESLKKRGRSISKALTGKKLSRSHRANISKSHKGLPAWNKGIPMQKHVQEAIIKANTGRTPWNKGLKNHLSKEAVAKISRASRLKAIEAIKRNLKDGNQLCPNFNPDACNLIDEYGKTYGYNFIHAMNGGEHRIKELGYWVDGYDSVKNVVIEVDESHHFDTDGNLTEKDVRRQNEIIDFLACKFIRLKI